MDEMKNGIGLYQLYGLSPIERDILFTVSDRLIVTPNKVAQHCYIDNQDWGPEYKLSQYSEALSSCIKKGWLTILSEDECYQINKFPVDPNIPELDIANRSSGTIDFTTEGYFWFREFMLAIRGLDFIHENDSGWIFDEKSISLNIYGQTKKICLKSLNNVLDDIDGFFPNNTFVCVEGPVLIGKWKPIRFLTIPIGFHINIRGQKM